MRPLIQIGLNMKQEEKNFNDTLFNEIIITYNNPRHLMHKKMTDVLKYVQEGGALIDVGCGVGEFIFRLQDRFHTLGGVDISRPEIEFTQKRIGNSLNVFLHYGELESFHFRDKKGFDSKAC